MIQGRKKPNLTTDSVLEKISEYDIYRFYMPHQNWKINVVTYSPFRNEKNPSFIIGYRGGILKFIDFGDSSKRGNCFNFVMMLFNISLNDALLMIDRDFGLGIVTASPTKKYERIVSDYAQPTSTCKREYFIQVKTRKFTHEELAYWNGYYQDIDDLRANNVYSIDTVYLNKKKFPIKDSELRFGPTRGPSRAIRRSPFSRPGFPRSASRCGRKQSWPRLQGMRLSASYPRCPTQRPSRACRKTPSSHSPIPATA